MITRFYLEDYLSFEKLDLTFQPGLIVFSGPSGAGKSVFMNSILSLFTTSDSKAKITEAVLENHDIENENYNISGNEEFVIKQIINTKTRYFLNAQFISKKELTIFSKNFFKHLHLKDTSDFLSSNIIEFLDFLSSIKNKEFSSFLKEFKADMNELNKLNIQLKVILEDEKNIEDLKELTSLQIQKIAEVNPYEDEYDELKDLKNILNQKDKIDDVLSEIKPFLNNAHTVSKALELLNINSSFFDETINEVNSHFEKFYDKIESIDDINIEETLDRIEDLSKLIKKYGSIKEALEFKKEKEIQLESYDNITFEKIILQKNIKKLEDSINVKAKEITLFRQEALKILQDDMNKFLKYLYLDNLSITIKTKKLDINGIDEIEFKLNDIQLNKISSGEFNRLRLALLTSRSIYEINTNGILFLDEIDANLSGKESASIAKVLDILSKNYQIFAISHQPQLSSTASQHFLVSKENNKSTIKLLNNEQRVDELARMISGEDISKEAKQFAQQLIKG